jgi:hypothetical protein
VLVLRNGYVIDVYVNPECVEAGCQARSFRTKDELSGFDLVADLANEILRNRFVGRELATTFVFNRFTYEKILLPRGRF